MDDFQFEDEEDNFGAINELPDKEAYKIGEAADIVGVKPYILRYWESEFKSLAPRKTRSRHRLFRRQDIELLLLIKRLLYEEMYTVAGAKKRLQVMQEMGEIHLEVAEEAGDDDPMQGTEVVVQEQRLQELRAHLEQLRQERNDALEVSRETNEALAEVQRAHQESTEELSQLQQEHLEVVAERDSIRSRLAMSEELLASLREERDDLRQSLHKALEERAALGSPDVAPAALPVLDDGWSSQSANLELTMAHQAEKELRNKLRYQVSSKQRVLKEIRGHVQELLRRVQAATPD